MPWKRSPMPTPTRKDMMLPASICEAADMKGAGRSCPRLQIEPKAQNTGAASTASAPGREPRMSAPRLSQTTPAKPITRPSHSPRLGWWPRSAENAPAHSGIAATPTATRPLDTVTSA
jgi:hypothetical protein